MLARTWLSAVFVGVALSVPSLSSALTEWKFHDSSSANCVSGCNTGSGSSNQEVVRVHAPQAPNTIPNVSVTMWSNAGAGGSLEQGTSGRWSGLGGHLRRRDLKLAPTRSRQ